MRKLSMKTPTGLDRNKLPQVWNIACHFCLPCFRCAVGCDLQKSYKCRHMRLNVTHINNLLNNVCYILLVKVMTKYSKKTFLVFIIFYICTFCPLYKLDLSQLFFLVPAIKWLVAYEHN